MSVSGRLKFTLIVSIAVIAVSGSDAYSQTDVVDPASNNLPNPNPTVITKWGPLPDGRTWGIDGGCRHWPRRTRVGL